MEDHVNQFTENLLTPGELAKRLNTPVSWIYGKSRLAKENGFPVIKVGKYTRYRWDQVQDWLRKQQGE